VRRAVALYRSPAYSPQQHLANDRAILDATLEELAPLGWDIVRASERDVNAGSLPAGQLYLNMCQGVEAATRLRHQLPRSAVSINRPSAVQACHRYHLVPRLQAAGVPFPRTVLVSTEGPTAHRPPVELVTDNGYPVWVKRGDVHAETPDDVVAVPVAEVSRTLRAFAARGISVAALQQHQPGPVVKFYGVANGRFFHWYGTNGTADSVRVDVGRLQATAEQAAAALGLEVYGGDAVVHQPSAPMLIDLNDWPSFAPVRAAAAAAIARHAHDRAVKDKTLCSTP
jgi:hypothetical protein